MGALLRITLSTTLGLAFASICASAAPAFAQSASDDPRWAALSPSERLIVDRVAADFYEDSLRATQSAAIEAETSDIYRNANADEQARFRDERRAQYRDMTPAEQAALKGVTRPAYRNLAEGQKAPFRAHAIDVLTSSGAVDEDGLDAESSNEI